MPNLRNHIEMELEPLTKKDFPYMTYLYEENPDLAVDRVIEMMTDHKMEIQPAIVRLEMGAAESG